MTVGAIGYYPFSHQTAFELLNGIVRGVLPELFEGCSKELRSFLACCLHKNPEHRMSAEELLLHPWLTKQNIEVEIIPNISNQARTKTETKTEIEIEEKLSSSSSSPPTEAFAKLVVEVQSDAERDTEVSSPADQEAKVSSQEERETSSQQEDDRKTASSTPEEILARSVT